MKTTSFEEVCKIYDLEYIEIVKRPKPELKKSEYYAVMVTTGEETQYTKGIDIFSHVYIIGVERPNENMGCYISKDFYKRDRGYRGPTILVKVKTPNKYTIL